MSVVESLAKSNCVKNARVIIEKPFGHDLASAQELNAALHSVLFRSGICGPLCMHSPVSCITSRPPAKVLHLFGKGGATMKTLLHAALVLATLAGIAGFVAYLNGYEFDPE